MREHTQVQRSQIACHQTDPYSACISANSQGSLGKRHQPIFMFFHRLIPIKLEEKRLNASNGHLLSSIFYIPSGDGRRERCRITMIVKSASATVGSSFGDFTYDCVSSPYAESSSNSSSYKGRISDEYMCGTSETHNCNHRVR